MNIFDRVEFGAKTKKKKFDLKFIEQLVIQYGNYQYSIGEDRYRYHDEESAEETGDAAQELLYNLIQYLQGEYTI